MFVAQFGDYLVQNPIAKQSVVVAMTDSLCHGLIAGISWFLVCEGKICRATIFETMTCAILAMTIDVDHFLAARSLNLHDAVSLKSRPCFHATSIIVVVDILLLIINYFTKNQNILLGALIFTISWLTHHVRDGLRRGLWFYPIGETPPLPRPVFIGSVMIIPLVSIFFYACLKSHRIKQTTIFVDV